MQAAYASRTKQPTIALIYQTINQSGYFMYVIELEADVHNNMIQVPIEYRELEAKRNRVFVVEVSNRQKKLPAGFLNPVAITSYKNIAKRDDLYDRYAASAEHRKSASNY